MRNVVVTGASAAAVALLLSGGGATTAVANPGDHYVLPVHHFEQQGNFNEIPNVGYAEISPGVFSSAWQHETNPSNPFGGDLARIYWKTNIPALTSEPKLYALEWWDPTPGSDSDFHIIESIYNGDAGDPGGVNPAVPWGGQFGTNKQWMKTTAATPGGGLWRQAGGGPQAPSSPDYVVSGGNPGGENPGGNPSVSFMWLKKDSLLFAKWDFNFGNPDGTFIDRTYAELRITEVPVTASTLYWDVNQTTAGAGTGGAGTAPTGNWNGTTPNFNKDPNGGGPAATRAMTFPVDTINFAAGIGATGTYTVNVSGTRYALAMNIQEGNVTFTGGTIAVGTVDVSAGASSTVSSVMAGGSSNGLVKTGPGTLTLTATNNAYTGGTTVQAGTLEVKKMHANNAVNITGGTLRVLHSNPTGPNPESGDNAFVSQPSSLSILPGATLDITNNDVIVAYTGSSPAEALEDLVANGFNGGGWDGAGITSSTAPTGDYAVGIADNALLAQPYGVSNGGSNFDGVDVPLNSVLIKFTHRVDLNLDGLVTPEDAATFAGFYTENASGATWATGDLDYDGVWTPNDAAIFGGYYNESVTSLPEPASLGLLGVLAVGLVRRRRLN